MGITLKAVMFPVGSIRIRMSITPEIVERLAHLQFENMELLFGVGLAFLPAWPTSLDWRQLSVLTQLD